MALFKALKKLFGASSNSSRGKKAPIVYDFSSEPVEDLYCFHGSEEQYFSWILSYYFPELKVVRHVQIAGPNDLPVTFMLYRDDRPILAVFVCFDDYRNARTRHAVAACEEKGIPYQRYYYNFRNDKHYVVDRIRSAL